MAELAKIRCVNGLRSLREEANSGEWSWRAMRHGLSRISRGGETGLIDRATADALLRDVEANERKSLSFGSILAIMAALLFGAAILILVAANWEAFPRLARVGRCLRLSSPAMSAAPSLKRATMARSAKRYGWSRPPPSAARSR